MGNRINLSISEDGNSGSFCLVGCAHGTWLKSNIEISPNDSDDEDPINVEAAAIAIWHQKVQDGFQYSIGDLDYNTEREMGLGNIDNVQKIEIFEVDGDTVLLKFGDNSKVILNGNLSYSRFVDLETKDGQNYEDGSELAYHVALGVKFNKFAVEYIYGVQDFDFDGDDVELAEQGVHTNFKFEGGKMQVSGDLVEVENTGLGSNDQKVDVLKVKFDYKF